VITLAHVGDFRVGSGPGALRRAYALRDRLVGAELDHLVVTGDLTEHGVPDELVLLRRALGPLVNERVTLLPGPRDASLARAIAARRTASRRPDGDIDLVVLDGTREVEARFGVATGLRVLLADDAGEAPTALLESADVVLCRRAPARRASHPGVHAGNSPALLRFDEGQLRTVEPLEPGSPRIRLG
jgi:hypothetical protein